MNIILGSGLIGLLARHILGPSYRIMPFYKSRFYSYNPSLDDNFLVRDARTDAFVEGLQGGKLGPVYMYNKAWSIRGSLSNQYDKELCYSWMSKIFGPAIPAQSMAYYASQMNVFVYDIRLNHLYQKMIDLYGSEIQEGLKAGIVTEIGDHHVTTGGKKVEFENAVNTIPLNALYKLMGYRSDLKSRTIHYLHIETDDLDFEGANQVLVVDPMFDFYKVTNLAPKRYLIYCHRELVNPGVYLMQFIKQFEIIDGTSIAEAIPCGEVPNLSHLEKKGITCVGSNAQWDWCMDASSCIIRLLKIANNQQSQTTTINI